MDLLDYFQRQEERLINNFDDIRRRLTDSSVKGGVNEQIIGTFLTDNLNNRNISYRNQVIDSKGNISDEVDVVIYNSYQPFKVDSTQILLAEGVDSIIQVKAKLTTKEISRIVKNAQKAKKVIREGSEGDIVSGIPVEDAENFVERIPYICIAFDSELKIETAIDSFAEALENIPLFEQPDAIFVINKFSLFNFRDGSGRTWLVNDKPLKGIIGLTTGDETIYHFMVYITSNTPLFFRRTNPLTFYLEKIPRFGRLYYDQRKNPSLEE